MAVTEVDVFIVDVVIDSFGVVDVLVLRFFFNFSFLLKFTTELVLDSAVMSGLIAYSTWHFEVFRFTKLTTR